MKIGLDFDNTIVSYDALFHKIALERKLITNNFPINKIAVRNHLRKIGKEPVWTEMQGYVYGARLDEARSYPGALDFLRWAVNAGHQISIISHKTLHPFVGEQYDLHAAARDWVNKRLKDSEGAIFSGEDVFFEPTKEEKIKRIKVESCDLFVDDLPEILMFEDFPEVTKKVLFDPEGNYQNNLPAGLIAVSSWQGLYDHVNS